MFGTFIKKRAIRNAQKFIDKLQPEVNIHLHEELPMPSVKVLKKLSDTVGRINALEKDMNALTDDQLRAKTARRGIWASEFEAGSEIVGGGAIIFGGVRLIGHQGPPYNATHSGAVG